MLLLVSGATTFPRSEKVGHLIVPRQWNDPDSLPLEFPHAFDNGCFVGFDPGAYMRMLYAYRHKKGALFVAAPDAVGDAAETRYLWKFWVPIIRAMGHTPAFIAQDGLRIDQVPWDDGIALFIGGTTKFKESQFSQTLIGLAKAKGIWAHVGRVNGKRRYEMMQKAGADSIDGTGFSMHSDVNIPKVEQWKSEIQQQPELGIVNRLCHACKDGWPRRHGWHDVNGSMRACLAGDQVGSHGTQPLSEASGSAQSEAKES